jgi:hypothetical protein
MRLRLCHSSPARQNSILSRVSRPHWEFTTADTSCVTNMVQPQTTHKTQKHTSCSTSTMVPPLQHKLPRALQISVTPPHACPAPMRPTPTQADTYLPPSLVPLGASAGERTTFRSTGQRPDPTQPGSPQPSPQLPRGLSCSRPATQSSPRPQPTGQPNPSPQRAHRPIKPLAEPDQPMADAKPGQPSPQPSSVRPALYRPQPHDGTAKPSPTGPQPKLGPTQPSPRLSACNPAQPALSAHGPARVQLATHSPSSAPQPSLRSQSTAQHSPTSTSQPTAQARPCPTQPTKSAPVIPALLNCKLSVTKDAFSLHRYHTKI